MKPLIAALIIGGVLVFMTRKTIAEEIVIRIAEAIAFAEGFYVKGSRPARNHNPGDLTLDIPGGGIGVGKDGPFIIYANDQDGWADLRTQVRLMLSDTSRVYNSQMSILDVARRYTATDQEAWANLVARRLGVSTATKISGVSA